MFAHTSMHAYIYLFKVIMIYLMLLTQSLPLSRKNPKTSYPELVLASIFYIDLYFRRAKKYYIMFSLILSILLRVIRTICNRCKIRRAIVIIYYISTHHCDTECCDSSCVTCIQRKYMDKRFKFRFNDFLFDCKRTNNHRISAC